MIDLTTLNTCFIKATLQLCGQVYPEFFHAPTMDEEFNQSLEGASAPTPPTDNDNPPTIH
ncbi:MAG: hypothetical protein COB04_08800 [Gammaproteobacteria bacterium]|nr:MAG: hypothetical protein COB04_08800 [Gammaproteobacteria bacterium]